VHGALARAEAGLDTDGALGSSARKAGNVVFGMPYRFAATAGGPPPPLDDTVRTFVLRDVAANRPVWFDFIPSVLTTRTTAADRLFPPVPAIARGAAGIGHLNGYPLAGSSLRAVPLVLQYGESYFPSFSLLVAAHALKLDHRQLAAAPGQGVTLDGSTFHTDPAMQAYPRYYRGRDGKPPFKTYSFAEVYAQKVAADELRDKVVLIGLTAPALVDSVATPIGETMAPVVASAHAVSSLLSNDLFGVPAWAVWAQIGAIVLVGLYLMFVLPRFRLGTGLALSVLLLFLLVNGHFLLMASQSLWLPLMVPVAALLAGVVLLALRRLVEERSNQLRGQLDQANRSLGQMLQGQGQFDLAFEKLRHCAVDDGLLELLYNLGLDFERKRQFNRAVGVFNHIVTHAPAFRDSRDRIRLNQEMEKMTALGKGFAANTGGGTLAMSYDKLQKPMLGRYQVEREIGRGAMGMVYLGRDPRIGRTVAIKTMALSQEFDEEQLADVKARFFREAETAGRLNHPNIVTVYDVGEEQELSYIAMDFLQGKPLSAWCRPENLLPAEKIFDIIIKVAEALDYAHKQQVVHRDIKPANIMYDDKTGVVKVTDFGVACLVDSSKTKTGTVLGSPSYMSPEQLAGRKVDGRSDLFSLGVTFFQLLTGELPFVADSLASLMYKIANEKHVDVRVLRPDLPACVSTIVNRALYKDIEKRVQSGHHLANALRRCKQQISKDH
jgi:serine/threonine-protein kinase